MSWARWSRASEPTWWCWRATRATSRSCPTVSGRCSRKAFGSSAEELRLSLVQGGQALRFVLDFAAHTPGKRFEGLDPDPPTVVAPRARHRAVHEERRERVRSGDAEHGLSVPLGEDLRAPGVDEQGGLPRREEP